MRDCFDEGVLQSFTDGELSRAEAESVSLHLTHCGNCSTTVGELRDAYELMSTAFAPEFEGAVPSERLRQRIDAAIAGVGVRTAKTRPSLLATIQGWFAPLRHPAFAYGGLAAILLFAAVMGISFFRNPAVVTPTVETPIASAPVVPGPKPIVETASSPQPQPENSPVVATAKNRPVKRVSPKRVAAPNDSETVVKVKLLPGEKTYLRTIAALDSTIKANDRPMRPALRAEYERNLALVDRALAAARTAAKNNPDDPDAAEFVFAAYQSKVDLLNTVAEARTYNRQQ